MVSATSADTSICIHRYEVHRGSGALRSEAGLEPSKVTWNEAKAACEAAGWRLCRSQEWEDACDGVDGAGGQTYPTKKDRSGPGVCAIGDLSSPVRVPLALTGAFADCRSPAGAMDMMGNLWEWTDPQEKDEAGQWRIDKRGGGHYGAEAVPCSYRSVGSHSPDFEGTIGFRCCVDSQG